MKDTSDRMVDLSLASVYFEDEELAELVRELEKNMDELTYQFFRSSAMASRSPEEARRIVGLMQIAVSAENIANASGDLCAPVLEDMDIHPVIKDALASASEKLAKLTVERGSQLVSRKLSELRLPSTFGVWVLAVKGDGGYRVAEDGETVKAGDTLVVKGPLEGLIHVAKMAGDRLVPRKPSARLRGIRRTLAEMRDAAVLSVDLAYSSVILNLREPAELVRKIEQKFDQLNYGLWSKALRLARKGEKSLTSVLELVRSLERITDSADSIADLVLRGMEIHPVIAKAVEESDEHISMIQVQPDSLLQHRSLGEIDLTSTTGAYVLFIERGGKFLYTPGPKTRLLAGDLLVVRGSKAGIEKTKLLAMAKSS